MINKTLILDFLKAHKQEMNETFGVMKIGLFGSYVRDEQNSNSDIDIAVEIESNNKFRSFFGLKHYLEDNIGKTWVTGNTTTVTSGKPSRKMNSVIC